MPCKAYAEHDERQKPLSSSSAHFLTFALPENAPGWLLSHTSVLAAVLLLPALMTLLARPLSGHEIVDRRVAVGAHVHKFKAETIAAVGCMVDSCRHS